MTLVEEASRKGDLADGSTGIVKFTASEFDAESPNVIADGPFVTAVEFPR